MEDMVYKLVCCSIWNLKSKIFNLFPASTRVVGELLLWFPGILHVLIYYGDLLFSRSESEFLFK